MADPHQDELDADALEAANNGPGDDLEVDSEVAAAAEQEALQQAMAAQELMTMGDEPFDLEGFEEEPEFGADDDEPLAPIETADIPESEPVETGQEDSTGSEPAEPGIEGAGETSDSVDLVNLAFERNEPVSLTETAPASVKITNPLTPKTRVPSLGATRTSVDKHVFSASKAVAGDTGEKKPRAQRSTPSGRDLLNTASVEDLRRQAVSAGLINADEKFEFSETMEYLAQQTTPTRESVLAGKNFSEMLHRLGYATGSLSSQAQREKNRDQEMHEERLRELSTLEDKLVTFLHHWQNKAAREQVREVLVEIDAHESQRSDEQVVMDWLADQVMSTGLGDAEDAIAEELVEMGLAEPVLDELVPDETVLAETVPAEATSVDDSHEDQGQVQVEPEPEQTGGDWVVGGRVVGDRALSVADVVAAVKGFTDTERSIFMRRINAVPLDELEMAYTTMDKQVDALTAENQNLRRELDRLSR